MSSHWARLGMQPTADLAEIKRAYASLLKQHRPDEDPQGFAALHTAYKRALAEARAMAGESMGSLPAVAASEESLVESPQHDHTAAQDASSVSDDEDRRARQWHALEQGVKVAFAHPQGAASVDAWRFLEDAEDLDDLVIRLSFSDYLFECWLDFLYESEGEVETYRAALEYIQSLLHWQELRSHFEDAFGYPSAELLLGPERGLDPAKLRWILSDRHVGPLEQANYFARMVAALLDIVVVSVVFIVLAKTVDGDAPRDTLLIAYAVFLLVFFAVTEASPLQGTPGKVLFSMKVVTRDGRRIGILRALVRSTVFALSLLGFKIVVWINAFLGTRPLHDRASGSIVVKR